MFGRLIIYGGIEQISKYIGEEEPGFSLIEKGGTNMVQRRARINARVSNWNWR